MTRGGKKDDRTTERRCIVTGRSGPKAGLIRFVASPDGAVTADIAGKLPGRGIWVSADRGAVEKASAKNGFARAARRAVTVPEDLAGTVEALLARRLAELIGLARKAGQAVSGMQNVKDWLATDKAALLVQAMDGSQREKSRLRPPFGPDSHVACLTAAELGLAFGRDRVIHAALAAGGLADQIVYESARLSGIRSLPGEKDAQQRQRGQGARPQAKR